MTAFTAREVESAIENDNDFEGWGELSYGKYTQGEDGKYTSQPYRVELGGETHELKVVEETGGEDEGSRASVTLKIGTQFFRKDGYYASHYGYDWDGAFFEVEPRQVTVVQYERV